jgi:Arm DNA-binding domain
MASDESTTRHKARQSHKLSARTVAIAKPGRYGDGKGLWLAVSPAGAKKWIFRFSWQGRVTESGLGPASAVSLAEARTKAAECRKLLAAGKNPIEARKVAKQEQDGAKTFGQVAETFLASKQAEWRNAKHRAQWEMTLRKYAAPIWAKAIAEIATADFGRSHVSLAIAAGNGFPPSRTD